MQMKYLAVPAMNTQGSNKKVDEMFEKDKFHQILFTFITLQTCMNQIIEVAGSNKYKIPHLNKGKYKNLLHLLICIPGTKQVLEWDKKFYFEPTESEFE